MRPYPSGQPYGHTRRGALKAGCLTTSSGNGQGHCLALARSLSPSSASQLLPHPLSAVLPGAYAPVARFGCLLRVSVTSLASVSRWNRLRCRLVRHVATTDFQREPSHGESLTDDMEADKNTLRIQLGTLERRPLPRPLGRPPFIMSWLRQRIKKLKNA